MAQPRAQAVRPAAAAPAQDEGIVKKLQPIIRSIAMFLLIQTAMKYGMSYLGMGPKQGASPAAQAPDAVPQAAPASGQTQAPAVQAAINANPFWPIGTPLSMLLFTSTSAGEPNINIDSPLAVWDGLTYGNWNDVRDVDLSIDIPESVRAHNGSLWLDVLLIKGGGSDLRGKGPGDVALSRKQLTRFLPVRKVRKVKKLIGGDENEDEDDTPDVQPDTIAAHWSRNLTLTIVSNGGLVNIAPLPPVMRDSYILAPTGDEAKAYFPPVFANDFWLLRENLYPINETDYKLPLHVNYHALSSFKFQIFSTMTQSFEQAAQQQGTGAEMDELKRTLTETSPWLLITTGLVTVLHMLFEFLAFSSDIGHWRKKDKDLVGVSLNTILTNCFVQLVILLYLHDSSEQTSFMILFGQGIGLVIEAWKITKVVNIRVRPDNTALIGYAVSFEDKKQLSEDEKKTQEYDRLAFRYVSYFAIPALAGYTIYSLLYETHRGWYSFVVTTLAQAIYMFGFVQLVPQLIINYKLKSVAHMPMKAMMYKTLSTVVDDFFAFCIRMPWLHRLACFRDDVVFVVLLYQRWIYRVDYSRVNEYGQVNEGKVEPVGDVDVKGEVAGETKKTK